MSKKKHVSRPAPESLGLPLAGVETHAHLDMGGLEDEVEAALDRARAAGVARVGQVFLGPDKYRAGQALFADRPEVFFILGMHPHDAAQTTEAVLADMAAIFREDRAGRGRLRAMGEIGLDFYYPDAPAPEVMLRAFRAQLELARSLDLPVVVHSREAGAESVAALDDMGFADRPVLWHCFGGDRDFARTILDRGWLLSIPGPVTYAKNGDLMEAVRHIPLDRMVLETDCPFLAPEPWRGKRNEPAYLAFTAAKVAELKGLEAAEVWRRTAENAAAFFSLTALPA